MSKLDGPGREYLQGYGGALADFNRLFNQPVQVYEALQQAGLDYYDLKDAGMEIADLGEIARCRDAWKSAQAGLVIAGHAPATAGYGTSPAASCLALARDYNARVERETLTPDPARK